MSKVAYTTDGATVITVEGEYVRLLAEDAPTPGEVVLSFLDSIDPATFRQMVSAELDNAGMASDPVDVVVSVLRQVAAGA